MSRQRKSKGSIRTVLLLAALVVVGLSVVGWMLAGGLDAFGNCGTGEFEPSRVSRQEEGHTASQRNDGASARRERGGQPTDEDATNSIRAPSKEPLETLEQLKERFREYMKREGSNDGSEAGATWDIGKQLPPEVVEELLREAAGNAARHKPLNAANSVEAFGFSNHELLIAVPLDTNLPASATGADYDSSELPERILQVLVCRNFGEPLPGWTIENDLRREVDDAGDPLKTNPSRNWAPPAKSKSTISRSDLLPLYAKSFSSLAKLLEEPSVHMAFPMGIVRESGGVTLQVKLPFDLMGKISLSVDASVTSYFRQAVSENRGQWSLHTFGIRDLPPTSVTLGAPSLSEDQHRVTFATASATVADLTSGRAVGFTGRFRQQGSGVGAMLAGCHELKLLVPDVDTDPEKPDEPGSLRANTFRPAEDALTVPFEQRDDGTFHAIVMRPWADGEPFVIIKGVDWWPPESVQIGALPSGLWLASAAGGSPSIESDAARSELQSLLNQVVKGTLPRSISLTPLAWPISNPSRLELQQRGQLTSFPREIVLPSPPGLGLIVGTHTLVLPIPVPKDSGFDFGDVMIDGIVVNVELEALNSRHRIPASVATSIPIQVWHALPRGDYAVGVPDDTCSLLKLSPGQSLPLIVPGTSVQHFGTVIDTSVSPLPAWMKGVSYGYGEWHAESLPLPDRVRITIPCLTEGMRDLTLLPKAEKDEGSSSQVMVTVIASSGDPGAMPPKIADELGIPAIDGRVAWSLLSNASVSMLTEFTTTAGETSQIPVPRRSDKVACYWVLAVRSGYHPVVRCFEPGDLSPLVLTMTTAAPMVIEILAPDYRGVSAHESAGGAIPEGAILSEAAQRAGWDGRYAVHVVADRPEDGFREWSKFLALPIGTKERLVFEAPSGQSLRFKVYVDGVGYDLGKRAPEFDGVIRTRTTPTDEAWEDPDDLVPSVVVPISYPTSFSRWVSATTSSEAAASRSKSVFTPMNITCGGKTINLHCLTENAFGERYLSVAYPFADSPEKHEISGVGFPLRLVTGGQPLVLKRVDSTDASGRPTFSISHDLPVAVSLTLSGANELRAKGVWVSLSAQGITVHTSRDTDEPISLWFPPGKAKLEIGTADGRTKTRTIEVPANGTLSLTEVIYESRRSE